MREKARDRDRKIDGETWKGGGSEVERGKDEEEDEKEEGVQGCGKQSRTWLELPPFF